MPTQTDNKPELDGSHDKVELSPAEVAASDQALTDAASRDSDLDLAQSTLKDFYHPEGSRAERAEAAALDKHDNEPRGRLARIKVRVQTSVKKHKKGWLFGGGALAVGGIFGITAMFGLLAAFKLTTFQKSTDDVRMNRLQQTLSIRSERFMQSFVMAAIAGDVQGNPGQNRYFLAKGWYGNGNPITQWYRDLKTTSFFDELREKYGFQLASETADGGRLVAIRTEGLDVDWNKVLAENGGLDPAQLFSDGVDPNDPYVKERVADFERRVDRELGATNKSSRRFIKKMSRDTTRWWEVFERRHKRRWAMERLGITKWKFFENTREKVKKKIFRKWSGIIAERSNTTRVIFCLLSPSIGCRSSSLNNDENKVTPDPNNAADAERAEGDGDDPGNETPTDDGTKGRGTKYAKKVVSDEALAKLIATRAFVQKATSVAGWLELIKNIDDGMKSGIMSKAVAAAKMAQFATAYMSFNTIVDQVKAGTVSGEEVNATMEMFNDAELSDSYANMTELQRENVGYSTASLLPLSVFAAAGPSNLPPERQALWDPVTSDMKINTNNTATDIESVYGDTVGQVFGPINEAWTALPFRDAFVAVSGAVSDVFGALGINDAIYAAGDFVSQSLVGKDIQTILADVGGETLSILGASPMCGSHNTGGRKLNCIQAGAAASQEQLLESMGGHTLNQAEANAIERSYREDQADEFKNLPVLQRLANTDYPQSFASQLAMAIPTSTSESLGSTSRTMANFMPTKLFPRLAAAVAGIWSRPAHAAANTNLFAMTPKGLTPTELEQDPFGGKGQQECQKEQSDFDQALKTGSDEEVANLSSICKVDSFVASSTLAYRTNKDDGGLDNGVGVSSGGTNGAVGDIGESSDGIACPAGTNDVGVAESRYTGSFRKSIPLMIRLCQIPDIPGNGNDATGRNISGGAVVNSRVAGAWQGLGQAAKAEGVSLSASSSFRLADSCGGSGDGSRCAKPGSSPHQMGIAIDFNNMSLTAGDTRTCATRARLPNNPGWAWLFKNAERWGIRQYTYEAWHWDLLPTDNRCNSSQ